jgi:hypothetical protein
MQVHKDLQPGVVQSDSEADQWLLSTGPRCAPRPGQFGGHPRMGASTKTASPSPPKLDGKVSVYFNTLEIRPTVERKL